MHRADRGRRQRLQREIAIGHAVERIGGRPVEAKGFGGGKAVDREGGARQCRGPQRTFVQAFAGILHATAITAEHFDIGQKMMTESDRLCRLQMGKAGHHRAGKLHRALHQCQLQIPHLLVDTVERVAHPQFHVGGDLVIARARGMQAARRRTDDLGQA